MLFSFQRKQSLSWAFLTSDIGLFVQEKSSVRCMPKEGTAHLLDSSAIEGQLGVLDVSCFELDNISLVFPMFK